MPDNTDSIIESLSEALDPKARGGLRGAAAIRMRPRLQPAGGPGTKVMPPTYAGPDGPTYVTEQRVIGDETVECVSLDSVASQANRLEVSLAEAIEAGEVKIPNIWVDQDEFGTNSALEFSHRAFDAWIEDAELDGAPFGATDLWKELASSSRHNVAALMKHCPTSILLGSWASRAKNPQGTTRLARLLTSELLGVGCEEGERAAGRIDFRNISSGVAVYRGKDARMVTDPKKARGGSRSPEKFPGGRGEAGRPSAAGYGNVTPSLAAHGGVTFSYALQISTVSLPGLRECRFPTDGKNNPDRDLAGRLMLAALGMRMLAMQVDHGYDLRSGCLLVPGEEPTFELLERLGQVQASWSAVSLPTSQILDAAVERGAAHGIDWSDGDLHLKASEAQLALLRQSLERAEEDEG